MGHDSSIGRPSLARTHSGSRPSLGGRSKSLRRMSLHSKDGGSGEPFIAPTSRPSLDRSNSGSRRSLLCRSKSLKTLSKDGNSRCLTKTLSGSTRTLARTLSGSTRSLTRTLSGSARSLNNTLCSANRRSSDSSDSSHEKGDEQKREPYLLEKLGGMMVLKSVVQEFCHRATKEAKLQPFFEAVHPSFLHTHHERFFAMAFTDINLPQAKLVIAKSHQELFAKGLGVEHFDVFVEIFSETLTDRGFSVAIVIQVLNVVAPLRDIFLEGSDESDGVPLATSS